MTPFWHSLFLGGDWSKFEETKLKPLQKAFFSVMLIQFAIFYLILLAGMVTMYFIDKQHFFKDNFIYLLLIAYIYFFFFWGGGRFFGRFL